MLHLPHLHTFMNQMNGAQTTHMMIDFMVKFTENIQYCHWDTEKKTPFQSNLGQTDIYAKSKEVMLFINESLPDGAVWGTTIVWNDYLWSINLVKVKEWKSERKVLARRVQRLFVKNIWCDPQTPSAFQIGSPSKFKSPGLNQIICDNGLTKIQESFCSPCAPTSLQAPFKGWQHLVHSEGIASLFNAFVLHFLNVWQAVHSTSEISFPCLWIWMVNTRLVFP